MPPVPADCGFIRPECREVDDDGTVRVRLGVPAREWFNLTRELGEVLCLTRNPAACLARLGPPPAVDDWRNPWLPRATDGAFAPNLAEWGELWAVREVRAGGLVWSLDVRDPRGLTAHRLVLGPNSRRDASERFVREHQAPCGTARPWLPPNHAASAGRRARLGRRIAFLHTRSAEGTPDARRLDLGAVGKILARAARTPTSLLRAVASGRSGCSRARAHVGPRAHRQGRRGAGVVPRPAARQHQGDASPPGRIGAGSHRRRGRLHTL